MLVQEVGPLSIGGYKIDVAIENQHLEIAGLLGRYLNDDTKIMLRDTMPKQVIAETLLHEVMHAIAEVYLEGMPDGIHEHVIAVLSQGLFQVLQDNPDFTFFVAGGYEEIDCEDVKGDAA